MIEMFGEHPTLEAFGLTFCVLDGGSTEALVHRQFVHYFSASSWLFNNESIDDQR